MKNIRIIWTTCLLVCLTFSAFAQSVTPVKWAYKTVKVNDSVAELQFTANIEPNWHLYAQKPGQGQIEQPLVFNFTKSLKYERMGKFRSRPRRATTTTCSTRTPTSTRNR